MNKNYLNQNILIIGGSSSVGLSIAKVFKSKARHIIISFYKNKINSLKNKNISPLELNLNDKESINLFVKKVKEIVKKLDVIFISGVLPGKLESYNKNNFEEVMNINFSSQAIILQEIFSLIHSKSKIIMISSISAPKGSFDPIYAASKGAILSFVKSMVSQIPKGATINAIAPSLIEDTSMYFSMKKYRQDFHKSQTQSGELLKTDDLSNIIYDLCKPHWKHLNGSCIDINGGQYVR